MASRFYSKINELKLLPATGAANQLFMNAIRTSPRQGPTSPPGGVMRSKRVPVCAAVLVTFFSVGVLLAETDFSGEWTVVRSQDNTANPWVGDFVGLPLNVAGLAR